MLRYLYAMKRNCDTCGDEYEYRRKTSRFCSDKCRMAFGRENPKPESQVSKVQMQVLYNAVLDLVSNVNFAPSSPAAYDTPKHKKYIADEPKQWVEPKKSKLEIYYSRLSDVDNIDELNNLANTVWNDKSIDWPDRLKFKQDGLVKANKLGY